MKPLFREEAPSRVDLRNKAVVLTTTPLDRRQVRYQTPLEAHPWPRITEKMLSLASESEPSYPEP